MKLEVPHYTQSELEKIKKNIKDYEIDSTCITGIVKHEVYTERVFIANIQIHQYYVDIKFHVIKDNEIPVRTIIRNYILKDLEVSLTSKGILLEKIVHLTLQ